MTSMNEDQIENIDKWRRQALSLISRQKTLVLSTSTGNRPWAAPVYFVFATPAFYFFSSPNSKHMQYGLQNDVSAATVFSDTQEWEKIEGLQMVGQIRKIHKKIVKIEIITRYLKKFPFAKKLLTGRDHRVIDLSRKTDLFAFYPDQTYYMNNLMGFGTRLELDIQTIVGE